MSLRSVDKKTIEKENVSAEEKNKCLVTAIYEVQMSNPFMGSVLQCLNINYNHVIKTAGVTFNSDQKRYELMINPFYFCKILNQPQRKAVLLHELFHITHKHLIRIPFLQLPPDKLKIMNIAADMAINQFIKDLPTGCNQCPPIESNLPCSNEMCPGRCIDVNDYYDIDESSGKKISWPKNKPMETYYEMLLRKITESQDSNKGDSSFSNGGFGETLDEHMWSGNVSEKDALEAAEELIKRAMVKSKTDFSDLPGHIKELLEEIDTKKQELNYKSIIMSALKKHASGHDRRSTWTRKSKRFGNKAPGTKVAELPMLYNFIDTSGSISVEEANEFLNIVDNFLKVGSRKCKIGFFHTELYKTETYKLGNKIKKEDIQNGGTDLRPVLKEIISSKPDLSIIFTDGYYDNVDVESMLKFNETIPQIVFLISKDGQENHPLKRIGQTIKVPKT